MAGLAGLGGAAGGALASLALDRSTDDILANSALLGGMAGIGGGLAHYFNSKTASEMSPQEIKKLAAAYKKENGAWNANLAANRGRQLYGN
jgi:hypothetical protein